jgi:hypothetical protein
MNVDSEIFDSLSEIKLFVREIVKDITNFLS